MIAQRLSVDCCIGDLRDYIDGLRARLRRNKEYVDSSQPGKAALDRYEQDRLATLDFINELERIISCWEEGFKARNSKG